MSITIELPATLDVTSRDVTVTFDVTALTPDTVAKLVLHGIGQKIADAASTAATDAWRGKTGDPKATVSKNPKAQEWLATDEGKVAVGVSTLTMMDKARTALEANEWTVKASGLGVNGLAVLRLFKAMLTPEEGKALNKLSASEQMRKAADTANDHPQLFPASAVDAEVAKIAAERAARAREDEARKATASALRGGISFNI